MRHLLPLRLPLAFSALLCVLPVSVYAKFIVEFSDGHRMTVSNYEERGDMLKVYTSLGSFAFRKDDVVRITKTGDDEQSKKPEVTTKRRPTPSFEKEALESLLVQESTSSPLQEQPVSSSPLQDVASQIEDGLFRMRYVFALAIGIKALKLFFAASVR
ncbi:MAG: hypothetical protein AB7G75_21895 [Candidatus Binatia bacterium]